MSRHRHSVLKDALRHWAHKLSTLIALHSLLDSRNLFQRTVVCSYAQLQIYAAKEKLKIVSGAAHFDLVRLRSPRVAQYRPPPFRHTTTASLINLNLD